MDPRNNYRYSFNNRFGLAYVAPLGESDFNLEWTREDEQKLTYKKEFPNKVVLSGEAFKGLLQLEQSVYRCEFTSVTIERFCGGAWVPWFTGRISLNDGNFDLDRCTLTIKFDEVNPDQCLEDAKTDKINLLAEVATKRTVRLYPETITLETVEYQTDYLNLTPCTYRVHWGGGGFYPSGWEVYENEFAANDFGSSANPRYYCVIKTKWARYTITQPAADPSPGPEWEFISTTGGSSKYGKRASVFDCTQTDEMGSRGSHSWKVTTQKCKIVSTVRTIDNGLHLTDIITEFVSRNCPGLTVVSNFFQINPTAPSPINYVTGQTSKVNNLLFFQKSDVKRPNVSDNATIAEMSFEQLETALTFMFNARWRIKNNVFEIEHISFFTKNQGFDLTLPKYSKYVKNLRRYSYENGQIPQREEFKFMEASRGDFEGVPIIYSGACVTKESRSNVKTYSVDFVTTDVEMCLNNPDSKSSIVDDRGFVVMATKVVGGEYKILTEAPILSFRSQLNNPLSWAILQRDYHKHYRPLLNGNMNNVNTLFLSVKPTKKGVPLTIPYCCDDVFNPDDTIKTPLGTGILSKGTFSFKDGMLSLDILYSGEPPNQPPVANNDTANVVVNSPVIINVLANDTDADGNIVSVVIVLQPLHGTAVVNPDNTITYTPNNDYQGDDVFTYYVIDNNNQVSNNALVSLVVSPNLQQFDYLVARYIWEIPAGDDLDTFTGLINSGTPNDNNYVGYGQGDARVPDASANPYLYWGGDNTAGGTEAILFNIKKLFTDYPGTPAEVQAKLNACWWANKLTGDIKVSLTTYTGGTMNLNPVTKDFENVGGVKVQEVILNTNVATTSQTKNVANSEPVALLTFKKSDNTATIQLI